MLDPLQNILDCADVIVNLARPRLGDPDINIRWLAQLGEMDHVCEIHRQMQEVSRGNQEVQR